MPLRNLESLQHFLDNRQKTPIFGIIVAMKNWEVTVRNADGRAEVLVISSDTRNGVFAELKKLGKSAIRIEESPHKQVKMFVLHRGLGMGLAILAAVIAVIGVGLAVWLMMGRVENSVEVTGKKEGVAKERKIARQKTAVFKKDKGTASPKKIMIDEALVNIGKLEKPKIKVRELSPEEWLRITNRVFKTGTEQLMSIVFSTELGDMPMPIPPISEEDRQNIVSILLSENQINDADSEKIKQCKENVALAKKEMIEYLKAGGDPDSFLQYYFQELKNAFELRNAAVEQIREAWEEDFELGRQFLERVNEKFANEGIKSIKTEEFE